MKWTFWTRTQPASPNDCGTIAPLLSLYADGMASAEEARRVEMHLPDCAACREALAWMQATQRALAARPVVSPPVALRARIAEAIAASSAAPVPARAARAFVLRPAYAAAASLTALGVVVSYGLLHTQAPPAAKNYPLVAPPVEIAAAPSIVKPTTVPGVKRHAAPRLRAAPRPVRLNPDLVAVNPPHEAAPQPVAAKTHTESRVATRTPADAAPVMAPLKSPVTIIKKPALLHFKPELLAMTKTPVSPVETHRAKVVQPEPRKPETIVAVAPHASTPSTPTFVEKPPVITPDPAPTVVVASSHESHFQTADFLGPVREHLGRMRSVAYTTQRKSIKGTILAVSTMDQSKTPGVDTVRGSF